MAVAQLSSARSVLPARSRSLASVQVAVCCLAVSAGLAEAAGRRGEARSVGSAASAGRLPGPPEPIVAIVSLGDQRIDVFGPHGRVSGSRVSTGKSGKETPAGVFSILQRNRYHESNLYSNAPMPFMQRLTWSGIALHQGHLPGYRASHGCIRLPGGFAAALWRMGRIGMRVVVAPASVRPVGFAHAKLPAPASSPQPVSATLVRVATAGDDIAVPPSRQILPFEAAELRLAAAVAAKTATSDAVKPALERSTRKSAEARQAAAALRASAGILADAEEHLELERLAMVTVQTEAAEATIRARIRIASAGVEAAREAHEKLKRTEATASAAAFEAAQMAREAEVAAASADEELSLARKAISPITVFVSRDTGRVHVRQGFQELYEAPVTIAEPDRPLGTHLFTAVESIGASELRWSAVSVPTNGNRSGARRTGAEAGSRGAHSTAAGALDRIELPPEVRRLMSERLWPGASIIVSDFGLGETDAGTDFVILTR